MEKVRPVRYPVKLMEREDAEQRVELLYHGADAVPKLTVTVHWRSGELEDYTIAAQDQYVVDAFNHPDWYRRYALAA